MNMLNKNITTAIIAALSLLSLTSASCQHKDKPVEVTEVEPIGPSFDADSALAYCYGQCAFGPRVMNSEAHEQCLDWIVGKFEQYGCKVQLQKAALTGYDGTMLRATNIIASHHPERERHILICAHWDSRPWADNDPDSTNWMKPVMAANDGASGVAVMIELARLLQAADSLDKGVDFVCFDAEDWGVPQWSNRSDDNSWALGAQYWASHYQPSGYVTEFGILLDMVGGESPEFYQELMSLKYAPQIVNKVWQAAHAAGYSGYFPMAGGGQITDDHLPVNEKAGIPTIDIIPYYPNCEASSFGPTWHTVDDTMDHIDKNTLKAVGQTIIQVLFTR
jgi:hypothetical protein